MGLCFSKPDKSIFSGDFLDFEEIVKNHAFKLHQKDNGGCGCWARVEDFDYEIHDKSLKYVEGDPTYRENQQKSQKLNVRAMSIFNNRSPLEQTYSFEQEKTTTSSVSVHLRKGVKLPMGVSLPVRKDIIEKGQGIPRKITLSGAVTEEFPETVKWKVNQPVRVSKEKSAIAKLLVNEEETPAAFRVVTTVSGNLKVVMTKKGTKQPKATWMDVKEVFAPFTTGPVEKHSPDGPPIQLVKNELTFTTDGKVTFRYGVTKSIEVKEVDLIEETESSSD